MFLIGYGCLFTNDCNVKFDLKIIVKLDFADQ